MRKFLTIVSFCINIFTGFFAGCGISVAINMNSPYVLGMLLGAAAGGFQLFCILEIAEYIEIEWNEYYMNIMEIGKYETDEN